MELEIRAKINNLEIFKKSLNSLPSLTVKVKGERQIDTYIEHGRDEARASIIRIRRKKTGAILTYKKKSVGKDVLWKDIDIPLAEPDRLEDILLSSGYVYVVIIDKVRDSYKYAEFEINFDTILNLGTFVEIEAIQNEGDDIGNKIIEIKTLLSRLGCTEEDIIEKGYVKLMEESLVSSK